ncbi:MAG TPA: DUF488 domain-containing protein [Trueperaceae bacterium]|nr:DUF488 domain-containing protein [Trueperaceae bacterium]
MSGPTVYTVGHSTRSFEELVGLLRAHGVRRLVDVRTVPRSRRHPHFSREALVESLPAAGIEYRWLRELGGLRRPRPDSPNTGWRNESFRGFADHMQTAEFAAAVDELLALAQGDDLAIMCSEAVPWRCHRSLVGDALLVRGAKVLDIMSAGKATPHRLTPFARVAGTEVTYPPTDESGG